MQNPQTMTMLRLMLEFDYLKQKSKLTEIEVEIKHNLKKEIEYRTCNKQAQLF